MKLDEWRFLFWHWVTGYADRRRDEAIRAVALREIERCNQETRKEEARERLN